MPLKFACPSCEKMLKVKEELAGRKAACPHCKKILTIPHQVPAGADAASTGTTSELKQEELEDLASSLLRDKSEETRQAEDSIEVTCNYCDAVVQFGAELAGKQAPCPECKRILRIPQLAPGKKKNWQDRAPVGPSLAKREEEKLEDAWSSRDAERVSTEALIEAGAIQEKREPVTALQWAIRSVWIAMGLLAVVLGWTMFQSWRTGDLRADVDARLREAELQLPVGLQAEYRLLKGKMLLTSAQQLPPDDAQKSRQEGLAQLSLSIDGLRNLPHEGEKAAVGLALLEVVKNSEFGPEKDRLNSAILQSLSREGRQWVLQAYFSDTLENQSAEKLETAVPEMLRLISAQTNSAEQADSYGILGQELMAFSPVLAKQAADLGQVAAGNQFVFNLAILRKALNLTTADPPNPDAKDMVNSAAAALSGKYPEAVQIVQANHTLSDLERTRMLLLLARAAGPRNKAEMEKHLAHAVKIIPQDSNWERLGIVDLTLATGERALALTRAEQLLDSWGKARYQAGDTMEHLKQNPGALETKVVDSIQDGPARGIVVYAVARHNTHIDKQAALTWAETLGAYRAFALLGVLDTLERE